MKKERKKHLRRLRDRAEKRRAERHRDTVEGVLRIAPGGYGFVKTAGADGQEGEVFVPAKFVNGALDRDRVELEILPPRPGHPEDSARGPVGRVSKIIERTREELVGEVLAGGVVRPLNPRMPESVRLRGYRKGAKVGDWVRLSLKPGGGEFDGSVRQVLGRAGEIAADLDAVMAEFELPPRYGEADDQAALAIVPREIERREYPDLTVLTIDPTDAKDFDDALSVTPGDRPGVFEVGVHISDVDRSMDRLVALFYEQLFRILIKTKERKNQPFYPVHVILDDFACGCRVADFESIISVIRSRGIYVSTVIQSIAQLETKYKERSSTIVENCDTVLYLGGNDPQTARLIAERANKPVHEILSMPVGDMLLIQRGQPVRKVKRYALEEHCEVIDRASERREEMTGMENEGICV